MTIRVKLSVFPDWPLERQTPGRSGRWGNCEFFINQTIEECDFWVVYTGLYDSEVCTCPADRTLFVTYEPSAIHRYDERFLAQFASVLTSHKDIIHSDVVSGIQGQHWYSGIRYPEMAVGMDYDALRAMEVPAKDRMFAMITSDKGLTPAHRRRLEYVERLQAHFGERLHVYGSGFRDVSDKLDAILPYRYHLVMENTTEKDYWSEKLADTYLGYAYPLYMGCPNIEDYFGPHSLTCLAPESIDDAIAAVERVLADDVYETCRDAIADARIRVLERYNLFAILSRVIEQRAEMPLLPRRRIMLRDEQHFRPRLRWAQGARQIRSTIRRMAGRNQPRHVMLGL